MPASPSAADLYEMKLGRTFWLRTDKLNARGTCPVALRLSLPGHPHADVATGIGCRPADWQGAQGSKNPLGPGHPEREADADTLLTLYKNAKLAQRRLEAVGAPLTPRAVGALLRNPKALQPGPPPCLLAFMDAELTAHYLPRNRGTYETMRAIVGKLRAWHGAGPLPLARLPPVRAVQFYAHLLGARARGGEVTTANKAVVNLTALFRRGIKHGLWSEAQNPFACIERQAAPRQKKDRLTPLELRHLLTLDLPAGGYLCRARAAWFLQFYLRGERIGACLLLRWADIRGRGPRVEYQAQKHGPYKRVPIRPELAALLAHLGPAAGRTYVLPYLPGDHAQHDAQQQLTDVKKATALINKGLKQLAARADIDKSLTTHAARRTFASISRKVAGITATQHFLGHTTEGMTQQYLDRTDDDELNAAADRIFDSLL